MSNPNNLPVAGFQYIIDTATINQSANTIINVTNRIDQNQKKLTQGAESFDKAIGANNRSMRVFASELLNVTGIGGQATGIVTGLLSALNPLDVALVAAGAGVAIVAGQVQAASVAFERHQQTVANTARSYNDLYRARLTGLTTPEGAIGTLPSALSAIGSATTDAIGQRLGNTFGQAFLLGVRGELTPAKLGQIIAADVQNPFDFLANIGANAASLYIRAQKDAATQQYVQAAASRAQAAAIQDEINKMRLAGASIDALIPKYYELLKAKAAFETPTRGPTDIGAGKTGTGAFRPPDGSDIDAAIKKSAGDLSYLNPVANKFYAQFLDAQNQYQEQSQSSFQDHQDALANIARSGAQQRARIDRSYAEQLRSIDENLADARAQAAENLAQRIADAEQNTQEQRQKVAESYAERRAQIEQDYQDRVKQIQSDYATSLLDAVANRDAFALLRAQQTRDKQLKDAATTRDKDNKNAQKDYEKQQKELDDALAKQKAALQRDYERQLADQEKAAAKQRAKAAESYQQQLEDQRQSEADQRASEAESYKKRQAAIADAFAKRKAALVAALAEEQGITESQAKAIITSLKSILNPDQITELLKDLQKAIQAQINITVTPFKGGGTQPGDCPQGYHKDANGNCVPGGSFDEGGYTGSTGGVVHPGEWVIPNPAIAGYNRWQEVVSGFLSHASRTVSMAGRGGGGGGPMTLTLDVNLNNELLDVRIAGGTMRTVTRINRGAVR